MSFMPTVVTLATAGPLTPRQLPMSPYAYWAISFGSFLVLLALLWAFRNTAAKYDTPAGAGHGGSGVAPGPHTGTDPGAHH
jgi:hypothetical protein